MTAHLSTSARPEEGRRPVSKGTRKRLTLAQQLARIAELDALRIVRPLTELERREADRLAHAAYQREWRRSFARSYGHEYHSRPAAPRGAAR